MTDINSTNDFLTNGDGAPTGLPKTLNVLTILTFVGSALGFIFSLATPFLLKFSKSMMDKAESMNTDMPASQVAEMAKAREIIEVTQQNMIPLMVVGIVGIIACVIGAMWMRKLKKDGYFIYVAGEVLPILGGFIFMGKYQFADWKSYLGLIIPVVFIALYTMQRKHLTK
jgi:hypothetical protein